MIASFSTVRALVITGLIAALLVAVTVLGAALWVQSAREAAKQSSAKATQLADSLASCQSSAQSWESAALALRDKLAAEVQARQADRQRDLEAVRAAEAAKQDADRTLRGWMDRYAAAMRDAECAQIERTVICEVAP